MITIKQFQSLLTPISSSSTFISINDHDYYNLVSTISFISKRDHGNQKLIYFDITKRGRFDEAKPIFFKRQNAPQTIDMNRNGNLANFFSYVCKGKRNLPLL